MGRDELFRSCGVSAPGVVSKIFLAPLVGIYRRSLPLTEVRHGTAEFAICDIESWTSLVFAIAISEKAM